MSISARTLSALVAASMLTAAACTSREHPAAPKPPSPATAAPRLRLDAEASPLTFRWLANDAVLVPSDVGQRKLAGFGNYVERAAQKVERARLSVWDDEAAWKLGASGGTDATQAIAHKRAEFVKDAAPPDPVERFLVFGRQGEVLYERDFRSYPLTELD